MKCGVCALLLVLVCCVRLGYRQYYGQQKCEMTYMWQLPRYQEVPLPQEMKSGYPQYNLYLYYERSQPRQSFSLPLRGVPALFLPGNAGSYKQARSSASIALRMHSSDFPGKKHFDFFTIDFNEELSGVFGGILQTQTDYIVKSIHYILSLYEEVKPRPKSVVIIGHSMGGVVARAIFAHPDFNHTFVTTIIALSSPLRQPVLTFDPLIQDFYDKVEAVWSEPSETMSHVTLVSVSGGERDVMVPTHLSLIPKAINLVTSAIPRNWASADHLAVVWCRRVQLAVTRALFLLQDGGRQLSANYSQRQLVLQHLLLRGKEIPLLNNAEQHMKLKDVLFVNSSEFSQEGYKKGHSRVAVPLSSEDHTSLQLLAASNTDQHSWVHLCFLSADTLTCRDLSSLCSLLPPKDAVLKVVLLSLEQLGSILPGATHMLVSSPTGTAAKVQRSVKVQQCDSSLPNTLALPWLRTSLKLPRGHCSLTNLSLPHLNQVWQAYSVEAWSECGGVAGGLVVPWYPQSSFSNTTLSPLTFTLSLLAPPPLDQTTPPPHLLIWSSAECELELVVTSDPLVLLDKLAILHSPLLLPWVTGLCVSASSRWLKLEILLIVLLQAIIATGSDWIPGMWDWVELYPLWRGCGPVVLHILAYGLQQLLYGAVSIVARACQATLGRCGRGLGFLLLGMSVLSLWFCSSISLLLATLAVLATAKDRKLKEIVCVLLCWVLLTLPSLFSWARALRFSLWLFPDPLRGPIMASLPLLGLIIVYTSPGRGGEKGYRPPLSGELISLAESALGMAIVLGCLTPAYRMQLPVLCYLFLGMLTNL